MNKCMPGKRAIIYLLFLSAIIVSGLVSCKKSGTDCFTSTGKIARELRSTEEFDSIDLEDNVNLIIRQDTAFRIEAEAGQNLLDGIDTKVSNRQLVIRNRTICNWLRSYSNPINVYVSVKNLKAIYYNSAGNITTVNSITSDKLKVDVWGGAGTINMDLNIKGFGYFYIHMGTADFNLHGNCSICLIYAGDYGLIQATNLQTGYAYVTNHGTNDIYVRARQLLDASIESIGNIYYTGNPDSLVVKIHGSGQVIPF